MESRRDQIVRAATEIASESGMASMSVRSVAARAGIGATTLRHYFPTQRALLEAVAVELFDRHYDDQRIDDPAIPPARRLFECARQFLPADEGGIAHVEAWLAEHVGLVDPVRKSDAALAVAAISRRARDRVAEWLAILGAEGALRHPDVARNAGLLFAMIDGLGLALLRPDDALDVAGAHALLAEFIETMIVK